MHDLSFTRFIFRWIVLIPRSYTRDSARLLIQPLLSNGPKHPRGNARPRSSARREARLRKLLLAAAMDCRRCFDMHGAYDLGAGPADDD